MKILFVFIFFVSALYAEEKLEKESSKNLTWEYHNAPKEILEWFDSVDCILPPESRPATAVEVIEN
jgi:hypothetical protein